MAVVVFPVDVDGLRPSEIIAEPVENVFSVTAFAGNARHAEYPHPVWLVDLIWEGRSAAERASIHGFFAGMGGPLGVFRIDAYDYSGPQGGLTGSLTVSGSGQLGRSITVSTPSGVAPYLRCGDRISLSGEGDPIPRYVHVVTEDWSTGPLRVAPRIWVSPGDGATIRYRGMSSTAGTRVQWVLRLRDARQAAMITRPPMESDFRVSCISDYDGAGL